MAIRVLIVEDQRIVREGLVAMLEDEEDIDIVGEAANGQEALTLFAELTPDIVLMDLQMPIMDGPTAIQKLRKTHPDARILVLTTYATDEFIFKALRAGANGYILKDTSGDELMASIQAVHAGQTQLSPEVAARLVAGVSMGTPEPLTPRELEVLTLMGKGHSNSEIADSLVIAPRTVKVHVQNILGKLGASNRTEAVSIAVRQQFISL
ncbi:MAG: response regulator transcription factor [Chloroflexi bacterium AL-W]|nr:response regulator transcription factor [Chloroflexi bacterium AL-N1]NOK65968.1 response regulator transcription factor [Chloroflexi bacterium AL-N10]NOK72849.1 response regulator transcription factor [Chloroflexi bacterium AL-N5]NOK79746.1 response regulator transcription factor [Chloroflexi bacterium AL-W]NOK88398.1 response regulator transcription factor [Chloroflexi bacterium AL-N15]